MSNEKKYNFGEKKTESVKNGQTWMQYQVCHTSKYLQAKKYVIDLIESKKYPLEESDFWIFDTKRHNQKIVDYCGLIISHNGCLRINDSLEKEKKFIPSCVSIYKDSGDEIVMQYINDKQGIFEFGEVSSKTLKNDYKYAIVLKRLMDRVILKNSKIGFNGIYSQVESEEFKNNKDEDNKDGNSELIHNKQEIKSEIQETKIIGQNAKDLASQINSIDNINTLKKCIDIIKKAILTEDEKEYLRKIYYDKQLKLISASN